VEFVWIPLVFLENEGIFDQKGGGFLAERALYVFLLCLQKMWKLLVATKENWLDNKGKIQ
jgi:hypothetical protein